MPMNGIEVQVGKATVMATTADTAYGQLVGIQSRKFFQRLVDMTVMTKEAGLVKVPVNAPYLDMNDLSGTVRVAVGLAENAEMAGTADESEFAFSGRRLTPESVRAYVPISQHRLLYTNIEGPGIQSTITSMMLDDFANIAEEIAINSENGGVNPADYGTGCLSVLDGWRTLADAGNIYDHEGDYVGTTLVRQLWNSLPSMWRTKYANKKEWRVFMNDDLEMALHDLVAQRGTDLGDRAYIDGVDRLHLLGIPIIPVSYIPTDVVGTLSQSASTDTFSWAMLVRPANMVIGYRPDVKVYKSTSFEGNIGHLSLWTEWAPQFRNVEEVAVAVNVTPDVDLIPTTRTTT